MISLAPQRKKSDEFFARLRELVDSGWWTAGKVTRKLEEEFCKLVGAKHAVATSSCTMSLMMAMRIVSFIKGISPGTYGAVLVSPLTFVSDIEAIVGNGLTPRFVDVDYDTCNIDVDSIASVLKNDVACTIEAVMPTHFAGYPVPISEILRVTSWRQDKVFIVEDCAHAVQAYHPLDRDCCGTLGDFGCFSFNPTKNVAAPEMGMITTNNSIYAETLRRMRLHGMSSDTMDRMKKPGQYDIDQLGYKANPTDVEALFALDSLGYFQEDHARRKQIWDAYDKALSRLPIMRPVCQMKGHGLHLYQIRISNRDEFILQMSKEGITCGIHYRSLTTMTAMKAIINSGTRCPVAERIASETVSLPLGPGMTDSDVDLVIYNITKLFQGTGRFDYKGEKS